MGFLIAEILGLLALAGIAGGMLTYWWLRREFVDVSTEYAHYVRALADLEELRKSKGEADARIATLEAERQRLLGDELKWRVGLENKLGELGGEVSKLENTDVSGIETGMVAVAASLEAIKPVDLDPVRARLGVIEERVTGLRNTELGAVESRVDRLTDAVNRLDARIEAQPQPDFSGIQARLEAIERALAEQAEARPMIEATPGSNLLDSASFGEPDDLKRISGVGPKLERMLNHIGVYYFWQVADWSSSDVEHVDDLLEVFKGRISRDQWVRQARTLADTTGSPETKGRHPQPPRSSATGVARPGPQSPSGIDLTSTTLQAGPADWNG